MKTLTEKQIRWANKLGLDDPNGFDSFRTPVLQLAYDLGQNGINLQDAPVVKGWRSGKAPESFISYNYRDGHKEPGLSLMAINGNQEHWSAGFIADRGKFEYTGILSGTGSDDEPCILSTDAEDQEW